MADEAKDPASAAGVATPKKKSRMKTLFKVGLALLAFFVVALAAFPAVATATFLTGAVRGQLRKQLGEGADVSKVAFGWTSGLTIEGIKVASGPDATVKDRQPVALEKVNAHFSLPGLASAVLTHGECHLEIAVETAKVYVELHPGGKLNIPLAPAAPAASPTASAPAAPTATASQPAASPSSEPMTLPCSAKSTLAIKAIDLEIADMTSSTGAIQRTVIKGLDIGVLAHLDRDTSAEIDTLKAGDSTFSFDEMKVTLEEVGKPVKLLLGVEKPSIVTKLQYAGRAPETAKDAPIAALATVHQVDAQPVIAVARIWNDDFDLRSLAIKLTVATENKRKMAHVTIDGILKGAHEGKVSIGLHLDLSGKPTLPTTIDVKLDGVDISGAVAKVIPTVLPILGGASSPQGNAKLPTLTFATKGDLACSFDAKEKLDKDPTLKSLKDDGSLKLGPGSLEGSKILQGLLDGFDKIDMKDVLAKAIGDKGFSFDSVEEIFNVKDGVVTIPKLALERPGFGLDLHGTCTLAGHYKMAIAFSDAMYKTLPPDSVKLLKSVDAAGGIGVEGDLGGDYSVSAPPADALAKAMLAGGALDIFRSRNPAGAAKLDGVLGKAGVSVDKVVNDPKAAAKDAATGSATKAADTAVDKNKDRIEKTTGVSADKAKDKINGLFGGDAKPDAPKKDDAKKDDSPSPFKNPFGGN
jgi:hypothetical protein